MTGSKIELETQTGSQSRVWKHCVGRSTACISEVTQRSVEATFTESLSPAKVNTGEAITNHPCTECRSASHPCVPLSGSNHEVNLIS